MSDTWAALTADTPLNDSTHEVQYPPVNGDAPDVVEHWGAASQVRWFARFAQQLQPRKHDHWDRWYVESVEHKGKCCISCIQDKAEGYGDDIESCCCEGLRARHADVGT